MFWSLISVLSPPALPNHSASLRLSSITVSSCLLSLFRRWKTYASQPKRKERDGAFCVPRLRNADPKPAIQRTWTKPRLEFLVDTVCIAFAITVFVLCTRNIYLSHLSRPNLNSILKALQFVANLHELVLGASLATTVLYLMRCELCVANGLPLGYIICAFQLYRVDQLLSKEFWTTSMSTKGKRKHRFGAVVFVAILTGALLGPSSAILIIPDLDWWNMSDPFSGAS